MPQPPEKKSPFVQTDIASIVCRHCGGKARLVRREPLAAAEEGEMLTFECEKCGKQSKAIVQE
jgi:DNA-directed RNA polymerase subunit M/transcription elongation factor TFIIS